MKLQRHPEYIQSLRDRQTIERCREAVEAWKAEQLELSVPTYGLVWTPETALALVHELQALFAAYNRVLWEQFPYCRACGGQCCVNEASHVGWFDGVAIALLQTSLPDLPPELPATDRACIYLAGRACSLPAAWRTIKCWSFFCLGGLWDPDVPLGERYAALTSALKGVLQAHLPAALYRYEQVGGDRLADHLHDPADLAGALDDALWKVFVAALHARYPLHDASEPEPASAQDGANAPTEAILAFVAEVMDQLLVDPPSPPEGLPLTAAQLLADLETLEWIVAGRPAHGARLLREMSARYAGAPGPVDGDQPSIWYQMHTHLSALL
jgi:hypothetical protein